MGRYVAQHRCDNSQRLPVRPTTSSSLTNASRGRALARLPLFPAPNAFACCTAMKREEEPEEEPEEPEEPEPGNLPGNWASRARGRRAAAALHVRPAIQVRDRADMRICFCFKRSARRAHDSPGPILAQLRLAAARFLTPGRRAIGKKRRGLRAISNHESVKRIKQKCGMTTMKSTAIALVLLSIASHGRAEVINGMGSGVTTCATFSEWL